MIEIAALCSILCAALVLVGGVAVLALSLAAKLADWGETRVLWPVTGAGSGSGSGGGSGFGGGGGGGVVRWIAGPAQVTAVEGAVVAAALVPELPVAVRLGSIGLLFAAYAVATLLLRGHRCACFGSWVPGRFTLGHAAACAAVAVLACGGLFNAGPEWTTTTAAATTEATAGLVLAALIALTALVAERVRGRAAAGRATASPAEVDHIVIFTAESCGFCAALEAQRGRYEAMTECPVEFRRADSEEDAKAAGGGFPAAVAYGADGLPLSDPAHGLAGIRDLLRRSAPRPLTQDGRARQGAGAGSGSGAEDDARTAEAQVTA